MCYFVDYATFGHDGVQAIIGVIRNAYRHIESVIKTLERLAEKSAGLFLKMWMALKDTFVKGIRIYF